MKTKLLSIFIGGAVANYMFQMFSDDPNMMLAFDRTWFQGTALFSFYIVDKYIWRS